MNQPFLSCGGLGCSPVQLALSLWSSYAKPPQWFPFADRETLFTYQCRSAIATFCQLLQLGPGDEVIAPAYNCGAEIDPYLWTGAKVVFYRVDKSANLDLEDIIRRVTPSTRLIHVTHFFGWPQEMSELDRWRKQKGLYLLEDCALSLFSKGPHQTIGQIGDAAVFSFPKSLPVPDGGALLLKKGQWRGEKPFRPPAFRNTLLTSLPLVKHWFMHEFRFWQRFDFSRNFLGKSWLKKPKEHGLEIQPEMPTGNYFDGKKIVWSPSRFSNGILAKMSPDEVVRIRRRNYQFLHNAIAPLPTIHPLFGDVLENVCPLSFPALVKDRNYWYRALSARGILVGGWPSYHRGFDWKEFQESIDLKNNLLTLPVHQNLSIGHMEYVAECVRRISDRLS